MTTRIETDDLRRALEALWTDMGVLARSPLVEQLGLVEGWPERDRQDAYKRASALIDAIFGRGPAIEIQRRGGGVRAVGSGVWNRWSAAGCSQTILRPVVQGEAFGAGYAIGEKV
jgi:hypothetical protein